MAVNWIEALQSARESDLFAIDGRIEGLRREIEGLTALRKVIAARLGKLPPIRPHRKTPEPIKIRPEPESEPKAESRKALVPAKSSLHKHREQAARYLLETGPSKPSVVAFKCSIATSSTQAVFDHPWFEHRPEGLVLTAAGRSDMKHSASVGTGDAVAALIERSV